MGHDRPLTSVVTIFKDEQRFLTDAIASVQAQTHTDWELILVDDGSTDASTEIARQAAGADPHRIRYVEHPGHANRGMSASRNLGIGKARGRYVASLDGDDVWLPHKLERQVQLLEDRPEAAMVFAPLLRWYSWTDEPDTRHLDDLMGVGRRKHGTHPLAGQLVRPPRLVHLMLSDDYYIPGGALIRRDALESVGRYEEAFRGMYEDAVTMIKIALAHPVLVDDQVVYLYRMHADSCTSTSSTSEVIDRSREAYLAWVQRHFRANEVTSQRLWADVRRANRSTHRRRHRGDRAVAVAMRIGRHGLPRPLRDRLRQWRWDRTRPDVELP